MNKKPKTQSKKKKKTPLPYWMQRELAKGRTEKGILLFIVNNL